MTSVHTIDNNEKMVDHFKNSAAGLDLKSGLADWIRESGKNGFNPIPDWSTFCSVLLYS